AVRAGAHIRPRGGDVREGERVVSPPLRLGPTHVGALAAAGVSAVVCGRRPRVAVLATGSELRAPGETLAPGQIFESTGAIIAAALAVARALRNGLPFGGDEVELQRAALAEG